MSAPSSDQLCCRATVAANAALEEKIRELESEVAGLLRKLSKVGDCHVSRLSMQ